MEPTIQDLIIKALVMGVVATIALDLWAIVIKYWFNLPPTNWAVVGRWFIYIPKGRFKHDAITQTQAIPNELLVGWSMHYIVGISYAVVYVLANQMLAIPITFLSAVLFGLITLLAPWLIMQPGLGLGKFASRSPTPSRTRLQNITAHLVFAAAMYFVWVLLH